MLVEFLLSDTIKLLETPKAFNTKLRWKHLSGQEKKLGYSNKLNDALCKQNGQSAAKSSDFLECVSYL